MTAQVRGEEQEDAMQEADLERHMRELANAVARHGADVVPASSPGLTAEPEEAPLTADMPCPCGSGKPFGECHGAEIYANA